MKQQMSFVQLLMWRHCAVFRMERLFFALHAFERSQLCSNCFLSPKLNILGWAVHKTSSEGLKVCWVLWAVILMWRCKNMRQDRAEKKKISRGFQGRLSTGQSSPVVGRMKPVSIQHFTYQVCFSEKNKKTKNEQPHSQNDVLNMHDTKSDGSFCWRCIVSRMLVLAAGSCWRPVWCGG